MRAYSCFHLHQSHWSAHARRSLIQLVSSWQISAPMSHSGDLRLITRHRRLFGYVVYRQQPSTTTYSSKLERKITLERISCCLKQSSSRSSPSRASISSHLSPSSGLRNYSEDFIFQHLLPERIRDGKLGHTQRVMCTESTWMDTRI